MAEAASQPSIDVCAACGKLFPRVYVKLCPSCALSDDNRFALVRGYLRDNEGASIGEIAAGTGLSRGDVARFQSQGRLVAMPGETSAECRCIPGGPRCPACQKKLVEKFGELSREMLREVESDGPRPGGKSGQSDRSGKSGGKAGTDSEASGSVRYVRRMHRTD